jgi:cytochrome c oxidase subunit 2
MIFTLFAVAALIWLGPFLLWTFSPRSSASRLLTAGGMPVLVLAAISIVSDLRSVVLRFRAPESNLLVVVNDTGKWLQLKYTRHKISFLTANELHVPAGAVVDVEWRGPGLVGWSAHDFLPADNGRWRFIAEDAGVDDAWLIRLWPAPRSRRLRIVSDPPSEFARWFANEAKPADPSAAAFFTSCGCAYCHVIRGVAERPWKLAPDLTHFAARGTIAGTTLPNRRGFLAGWVVDPNGLKPGTEMPPNRLDPVVLHRILNYLESLR